MFVGSRESAAIPGEEGESVPWQPGVCALHSHSERQRPHQALQPVSGHHHQRQGQTGRTGQQERQVSATGAG